MYKQTPNLTNQKAKNAIRWHLRSSCSAHLMFPWFMTIYLVIIKLHATIVKLQCIWREPKSLPQGHGHSDSAPESEVCEVRAVPLDLQPQRTTLPLCGELSRRAGVSSYTAGWCDRQREQQSNTVSSCHGQSPP